MKRSLLSNKFLNRKTYTDRKAYNAQQNLCQVKKKFVSNLNTYDVTDNKTFSNAVKPLLTDKVKTKSKITLVEKKYKDNSTNFSKEII